MDDSEASSHAIALKVMFFLFRTWQLARSLALDESWRKNVNETLLGDLQERLSGQSSYAAY